MKAHFKHIHFFGLGFIQIKLDEYQRIHCYHPDLPGFTDPEEIHNHRYGFTSKVIRGELHQDVYIRVPGMEYVVCDETCQPPSNHSITSCLCDKQYPCDKCKAIIDPPTVELTGVSLVFRGEVKEGSSYFISHDAFHRVQAVGRTVTQLHRTPKMKQFAQVLRSSKSVPVCPFSGNLAEAKLWEYVEDCIAIR
jgi:hypothetical protein